MNVRAPAMPRKRTDRKQEAEVPSKQIGFRCPIPLSERLDKAADALGLDSSGLIRMVLLECLPIYEERGRMIADRKVFPAIRKE